MTDSAFFMHIARLQREDKEDEARRAYEDEVERRTKDWAAIGFDYDEVAKAMYGEQQ